MFARRVKAKRERDLASGPGKLTQALAITRQLNGTSLITGPLTVRGFIEEPHFDIDVSQRIGITHCADWPLRFTIAGSPFVSVSRAVR
jgi:DNA-3-methyladenine glycosylase